jgi:hypothetical protein
MSREIEEGDRWVVSVSLYDTEGPLTGTSVEREACKVALAGAIAALSGPKLEREPWSAFRFNCGCREGVGCMHERAPIEGMTCASWNNRPNRCPRLHRGMTWDAEAQRWVSVSK